MVLRKKNDSLFHWSIHDGTTSFSVQLNMGLTLSGVYIPAQLIHNQINDN
jgi:hypothetical protein